MAFPKNAKKYNNNVASAHCVNNSEGRKGFPEQDAKLQSTQGVKTTLLSTSINSDNLSGINSRFVINNFKFQKEDILMKDIKKILTIILSISLLFLISCGDRPTGSTTDGVSGTIPSEHNGKCYVSNDKVNDAGEYWWLYIQDGGIYMMQKVDNTVKPDLTEFQDNDSGFLATFTVLGNTYTYGNEEFSYIFEFNQNWNSVTMTASQYGQKANPITFLIK